MNRIAAGVILIGMLPGCGGPPAVPAPPTESPADTARGRWSNLPVARPTGGSPDLKPPAQPEKPIAPYELAKPGPPSEVARADVSELGVRELGVRAQAAAQQGNFAEALVYQFWYVEQADLGRYNLACYYARTGQVDAAFYWLQAAGLADGVDSQWARKDPDLAPLWRDPRWARVDAYLQACAKFFETADVGRVVVVTPTGYQVGTPITVVLWLHGMGAVPEGLPESIGRRFADDLQLAVVGISATKPRGLNSFVWADDPAKDAARLQAALAEIQDRVTVRPGGLITLGFSQGAQVGLEAAVRDPESFAGSIVLSPGGDYFLDQAAPSPLLARRGFVLAVGAEEHPGNVQQTADGAAWLQKAHAQVIHKPYPGVAQHTFPADFVERFPEWISFILKAQE